MTRDASELTTEKANPLNKNQKSIANNDSNWTIVNCIQQHGPIPVFSTKHMRVCVCVCTCVCAPACICACFCVHAWENERERVCVCVCVCVHTCAWVHVSWKWVVTVCVPSVTVNSSSLLLLLCKQHCLKINIILYVINFLQRTISYFNFTQIFKLTPSGEIPKISTNFLLSM